MIHIVFNEADVKVLEQAIELDENLAGEIVLIRDDYAVGPIANIYTEEGINNRKNWWNEVIISGNNDYLVQKVEVDDNKIVEQIKEKLTNTQEIIWIWAAQNKHDVCGYYWLMSQLKDYQGRIFILYLNNLPFINEKGNIFYPEWLHVIPPKEFLKAKKLARPITLSEFEIDPDEWAKLCAENGGVRLLEGGKKLIQQDYDAYDIELQKFISADWQKVTKVINQFLTKSKHTTGDIYMLWRLKQLGDNAIVEIQGEQKKAKDIEVKIKLLKQEEVKH